jgi:predicted nucleic acid-binding protein
VIVVDASAMVEWLLQTPIGLRVESRAISDGNICVPHLVDLEIAQALRKLVRARKIGITLGKQALDDYRDLDLTRYAHEGFLPRIWDLRGSCTAYDAVYITLAESLSAALITHDRKLALARGHSAQIEFL